MKYYITNLEKKYGELTVFQNLNMEFEERGTTCILGPSGCGKTTLLHILAGLIPYDGGNIFGFKDLPLSFIFQEDRLIPWKTVEENLRYVLLERVNRGTVRALIEEALADANLLEYRNYYPADLSGGMKQKVAILRAFLYPSSLLLMDEPFKSIDLVSKRGILDFFENIIFRKEISCIMVTHDLNEAIELGDKIIVLSQKPAHVKKVFDNTFRKEKSEANHSRMKSLLTAELEISESPES